MDKCDCWYEQMKQVYTYDRFTGVCDGVYSKPVGVCYGTKEKEECQCMGDRGKCDFYPEVREKAKKNGECEYCKFENYLEGAWGEFKIGKIISRGVVKYATILITALSDKGLVTLYYDDENNRKKLNIEKVNFCPRCGRKLS